jgi:hypothetical protein
VDVADPGRGVIPDCEWKPLLNAWIPWGIRDHDGHLTNTVRRDFQLGHETLDSGLQISRLTELAERRRREQFLEPVEVQGDAFHGQILAGTRRDVP